MLLEEEEVGRKRPESVDWDAGDGDLPLKLNPSIGELRPVWPGERKLNPPEAPPPTFLLLAEYGLNWPPKDMGSILGRGGFICAGSIPGGSSCSMRLVFEAP